MRVLVLSGTWRRELFGLLAGRRSVVRIHGRSMGETVPSGSLLVYDPRTRSEDGDIVVAACSPDGTKWVPPTAGQHLLLVKRVCSLEEATQSAWLLSDDRVGTLDSRILGACPLDAVVGVATVMVRPNSAQRRRKLR